MKSFVLALFLVLLISGCAGMPDIFGLGGGGSNVNKTELSPDLVIIQNINVIPNPPIYAGDTFTVSFEVKNQDDLNGVNDVKYSLFDSGLCNWDSGDNTSGSVSGGKLVPLQTELYQWTFKAPDNNLIAHLPAKCPIRFKVNYTYESNSSVDVDIISTERLKQLQRAGNTPSFTPSNVVGRGPIKIYFTFGSEMPVRSGNTLSVFINVVDKGSGLYGTIPSGDLSITFPLDLTDPNCGEKFNCGSGRSAVCKNNKPSPIGDIPIIKKSSPQLRCIVNASSTVTDEKTEYIIASLNYNYDVEGETSVGVKPTMT